MARRSQPNALYCTAVCLALASPVALSAGSAGEAASFPNRPIRIVVGFTPGGQPDITARLIGPKLYESLKQQVVVDNRPGAGGVIGTKIVADATPDGYTLLSVSAAHVILPSVHSRLSYHPGQDFAGITMTATASYLLLVSPSSGAKTVQELIALARARPGQLNFSSAGTGSGTHFAGEMFKQSAHIDVVHVPYKGVFEALTDTMTGRVQFFMAPLASAAPLVKDGKLRALGVSSLTRVGIFPDVPTLAESGLPGFRWDSWAGILAPARTPRAIINKLNREITRILRLPEIQQRLRALGAEPAPTTPAEFDKLIAEQLVVVAGLAQKAGIKAQ